MSFTLLFTLLALASVFILGAIQLVFFLSLPVPLEGVSLVVASTSVTTVASWPVVDATEVGLELTAPLVVNGVLSPGNVSLGGMSLLCGLLLLLRDWLLQEEFENLGSLRA